MRKHLYTIAFLAAATTQLGATDCGSVIRDPGFELWCGDELCAWKLTRGEIRKVPTWNEGDTGVELVGSDTAIQQLSPVDSSDGHCRDLEDGSIECTYPDDVCIEFSLLADIGRNAVVDLNVDVFSDGTLDHTQRLSIGSWQHHAYRIVVRRPFAGIRFELAKAGAGSAKLANIGAKIARNCDGLPVIDPRPTPLGSPCMEDADCASGLCETTMLPSPWGGVHGFLQPSRVCRACDRDNMCAVGEACGVGAALSPVQETPTACVPERSKQLGEQCNEDLYDARVNRFVSECASGYCTSNVCSTCSWSGTPNMGCSEGETCGFAWDEAELGPAPSVCSPNAGRRIAGESCATNADCASGTCNGTERRQCAVDGRACSSPAQCPFEVNARDGAKNTACVTVGIQGGTCQ